jgi:hypothetical protein
MDHRFEVLPRPEFHIAQYNTELEYLMLRNCITSVVVYNLVSKCFPIIWYFWQAAKN